VIPELEKLQATGEIQVIVVNNGDPEATRDWTGKLSVSFPVLVQERYELSKRYEAFATPFGFLIDERGVIASKGIINNRQHIEFVLAAPPGRKRATTPRRDGARRWPSDRDFPPHFGHVIEEKEHV
jgi:hypothetical protein